MICKAIVSPDRFSSSTQPRYETVWYCLMCTAPYLILRLLSFFNRFFVPNNMHLVLSSPKWIFRSLSTNQLQTLEKLLLSFVSTALTSLCWYTKQEPSVKRNNSQFTAWDMPFTYSKNNKGPKIDPCGTPQLMLATLEYLFFILIWNLLFERYDSNHVMNWQENPAKEIFFQ